MGANSTKINNCCSCLEQTQVEENQSSNSNSISRRLNNSTIQRSNGTRLSMNQEDLKRTQQQTNYQFILLGDKQSGKTTFINLLKDNISSTPLPTQYPYDSIIFKIIDKFQKVFLFKELDFDYYKSSQFKNIIVQQKMRLDFVFLLKYDNNQRNIQKQILDFSQLDLKKPCAIVINNFTSQSSSTIKQEVKKLLNQYSIQVCTIQVFSKDDEYNNFLFEIERYASGLQIAQAR